MKSVWLGGAQAAPAPPAPRRRLPPSSLLTSHHGAGPEAALAPQMQEHGAMRAGPVPVIHPVPLTVGWGRRKRLERPDLSFLPGSLQPPSLLALSLCFWWYVFIYVSLSVPFFSSEGHGARTEGRGRAVGPGMWGLGAVLGKEGGGGRGTPFSRPHLQEGSPVGRVEGVQRLLQPPRFRERPSPCA